MSSLKRVLVLNGSPRKDRSSTMVITRAFLEGLNFNNDLEIEIVNVSDLHVTPCMGCLSCWGRTAGECVIKNDDVLPLKEKIMEADLVIESYPLYFFGMPGTMKLLTDRLLGMMSTYMGQKAPEGNESFHGIRNPKENQKFLIISTCAYTEAKKAYAPLVAQYDCICGRDHYNRILVPQVKTLVDLKNEKKISRFLAPFTEAGKYFYENGNITEEMEEALSKPPFTEGAYKVFLNNFWESEKK